MTQNEAIAEINSAADADLAILRAQGCHIPKDAICEALFRTAFSCGANWAAKLIKGERA